MNHDLIARLTIRGEYEAAERLEALEDALKKALNALVDVTEYVSTDVLGIHVNEIRRARDALNAK